MKLRGFEGKVVGNKRGCYNAPIDQKFFRIGILYCSGSSVDRIPSSVDGRFLSEKLRGENFVTCFYVLVEIKD